MCLPCASYMWKCVRDCRLAGVQIPTPHIGGRTRLLPILPQAGWPSKRKLLNGPSSTFHTPPSAPRRVPSSCPPGSPSVPFWTTGGPPSAGLPSEHASSPVALWAGMMAGGCRFCWHHPSLRPCKGHQPPLVLPAHPATSCPATPPCQLRS